MSITLSEAAGTKPTDGASKRIKWSKVSSASSSRNGATAEYRIDYAVDPSVGLVRLRR